MVDGPGVSTTTTVEESVTVVKVLVNVPVHGTVVVEISLLGVSITTNGGASEAVVVV